MSKLKVAHVKISNILGIEELEFAPGAFTAVTGANGSGKTSTIEALRSALKGGHDATLLRDGADKGEIVLVLEDGSQLKKTVTSDKTDVSVVRDERKLSRPAEAIKALHDALSVNPIEFLRAPEKLRVDALLQVMPIEADISVLTTLTGLPGIFGERPRMQDEALGKLQGLDLIEACKKHLFDERTGVNRSARDKEGAIVQLRATLPETIPDAPATDADLLARIDAIDRARDSEIARVDAKLAGLASVHDEHVADMRARIAALQADIAQAETRFAEVKAKADAARQAALTAHQIARAGVQAELDGIKAAQEQHARFAVAKSSIERMAGELKSLKAESEDLTNRIDGLDAYKRQLLEDLPIPGLEVRESKLFRNGIAFDRLNTAQQVAIAVEVAKLRAGELGLICVDGLELMDEATFAAFREAAIASGLQLIVSRVGAGPLEITTL